MPGVQSNAIASAVNNAFGIELWQTGLAIVLLVAFIIIGGVKRIASAATLIIPFIAIAYILLALVVIFMNISEVLAVFSLIFRSAFGGLIGSAIAWGVKRAIYSNEAGQGNGAHPAAAAEVSHPAKQGLVQAFSVYIDTLFICSVTALMILFMGTYNVQEGSSDGPMVVENVSNMTYSDFTQGAVNAVFPSLNNFGSAFVAIALFFFAFTTIMSYYYIAETFYGTVRKSDLAWAFGDVGLGLMVWVNVLSMLLMTKPAMLALKDYERQKKEGKDPVFDPQTLGIKDADFWIDYNDKRSKK